MAQLQNRDVEIENIILDTSKLIKDLRSKITLLRELDINETEIIQLVFQAIMFEENAELKLAHDCMDLVKSCLGDDYSCNMPATVSRSDLLASYTADVTGITNATYSFGCELLQQLKQLRAYRNGYLFYQFMKMLDKDIVLIKFVPPPITQ